MAGTLGHADTLSYKKFRDKLLADSGNPTDPIEIMIIEQIALAHMNIGRLQFRSSTAESVEQAKAYGSMAAQLLGEFRRTALALQAFRFSARQLDKPADADAVLSEATSGGDQAPAAHPDGTPDTEESSKEGTRRDDATVLFPAQEPASGGRRSGKHHKAKRSIA
jgi:hypothetical protein